MIESQLFQAIHNLVLIVIIMMLKKENEINHKTSFRKRKKKKLKEIKFIKTLDPNNKIFQKSRKLILTE